MKLQEMQSSGLLQLDSLKRSEDQRVRLLAVKLLEYRADECFPDDHYAWLTCALALQAASEDNFGVGCIVVDKAGDVIGEGHNEVFAPRFRSDRHAEMVVLDGLEDSGKLASIRSCSLFTSIESCPMCLARLITSGIGSVFHVATDAQGGMVSRMIHLPPAWQTLAKDRVFSKARCSITLTEISLAIFALNVRRLDEKLRARV